MGLFMLVLVVFVVIVVYFKIFPGKILDITPALGNWAVVTGATDGIGKSFVHELAGKGFNVILISRTLNKLESVAKAIEEKFSVSTKIVQADFTSLDTQMYKRIEDEMKGMDIGVLINNVGTTTLHPEYFLELEKHHSNLYQDILNCNITSAVNMTRLVLPGMVNRRRGLVINISSQFSKFPSPLHTLYGATKSFLTKFSQDLDIECRDNGVHVHVLTTGLVTTKLSGVKKDSFFGPSPQTYVRSALQQVSKRRYCDGYLGHTMISLLGETLKFLSPEYPGELVLTKLGDLKNVQLKRCKECNPRREKI